MILKDRTNLINLFLFLLFLAILFLLKQEKIINRESDKYCWGFSLYSNLYQTDDVSKDDSIELNNQNYLTQIISAKLSNTYSDYEFSLEKYYKNTIINNDFIFSSDEPSNYKVLLPNTIKLEYYSFEENKFYILNTKLDYDRIIDFANKHEKNTNFKFLINILPKGKVDLYFNESTTDKKFFIQNLTSKEIKFDWEKLKIERNNTAIGEKTFEVKDNLKNIINFEDYIDLVKNTHQWTLKINLKEDKNSHNIDIIGFDNQRLSKNSPNYKKNIIYNKIPKSIRIENVSYHFDGNEILTAFKETENSNNEFPVEIICTDNNNLIKCFLIKGDITIDLKNIY